jgi:hypothetical protein
LDRVCFTCDLTLVAIYLKTVKLSIDSIGSREVTQFVRGYMYYINMYDGLHAALKEENEPTIIKLLHPLRVTGPDGFTLVHLFSCLGMYHVLDYLLESIDINIQDCVCLFCNTFCFC